MYNPTVIDNNGKSERAYDIYSRLLKDRIIFLSGEINTEMANAIIAQLLFLNAQDKEKDITMYINSPGGQVTAGLGIYDTMNHISCDVATVCIGMAASMGAFLLSSGTKGKRYALPNAEIMIHQPLGGARGQATDIQIVAENIIKIKKKLATILAQNTGQDYDKVIADTERDNYLDASEAKEYGLVDSVLE